MHHCLVQQCDSFRILLEYTVAKNIQHIPIVHHEETSELPGEGDNARNSARCTQARKATHGLDGQHQDVDRTARGRVNQNDRRQR